MPVVSTLIAQNRAVISGTLAATYDVVGRAGTEAPPLASGATRRGRHPRGEQGLPDRHLTDIGPAPRGRCQAAWRASSRPRPGRSATTSSCRHVLTRPSAL